MKKLVALSLATLMLCSSVFASEISVNLNGKAVEFSSQEPVIVEGRTLIPLRGVFEELGYEISWDNASKTATFIKDNTEVKVSVNSNEFSVNGESVSLDVPAQIVNGSMMLPLRAIGEATGLEVDWDNDTKTVKLISGNTKFKFDESGKGTKAIDEESSITIEENTETTTEKAVTEKVKQQPLSSQEQKAVEDYISYTKATMFCIQYMNVMGSYIDVMNDISPRDENDDEKAISCLKEALAVNDVAIERLKLIKSSSVNADNLKNIRNVMKYLDSMYGELLDNYEKNSKNKFSNSVNNKISTFNQSLKKLNSGLDSSAEKFYTENEYWNWSYSELSESEKVEVDKYRETVGEILKRNLSASKENSLNKIKGNGTDLIKAAAAIKKEISEIYLPERCRVDNGILVLATDILKESAEITNSLESDTADVVYPTALKMTFDICAKTAAGNNYVSLYVD